MCVFGKRNTLFRSSDTGLLPLLLLLCLAPKPIYYFSVIAAPAPTAALTDKRASDIQQANQVMLSHFTAATAAAAAGTAITGSAVNVVASLRLLVAQGNARAMYLLGFYLFYGACVKKQDGNFNFFLSFSLICFVVVFFAICLSSFLSIVSSPLH